MESEAGHYHLFIELADTLPHNAMVRTCWQQWLIMEAGTTNLEAR